jgi:hypothetical protein
MELSHDTVRELCHEVRQMVVAAQHDAAVAKLIDDFDQEAERHLKRIEQLTKEGAEVAMEAQSEEDRKAKEVAMESQSEEDRKAKLAKLEQKAAELEAEADTQRQLAAASSVARDTEAFDLLSRIMTRLPFQRETMVSIIAVVDKYRGRMAAFKRANAHLIDVSTESDSDEDDLSGDHSQIHLAAGPGPPVVREQVEQEEAKAETGAGADFTDDSATVGTLNNATANDDEESPHVANLRTVLQKLHQVTTMPANEDILLRESFELLGTYNFTQLKTTDDSRERDDLLQAQSFVVAQQYEPALGLLRPALEVVPADSELFPQLEATLFEAIQSQGENARAQRRAVLETRLARMQPGTAEYDELNLALARTKHQETQFEEEDAEAAELSEFQLLSDAARDSSFAAHKVGVSVKWLHELFLRADRELRQIGQHLTPAAPRTLRTNTGAHELEVIDEAIHRHFATRGHRNDQEVADAIEVFRSTYLTSTEALWDVIGARDYRTDAVASGLADTDSYVGRMWSATKSADVGRATVFVCHDSSNSFKDLDNALMSLVRQRQLDPSRTFVWMDTFCSAITMRGGRPRQHPFVPASAIESNNLVLLAMDSGDSPKVLRNGPCRAQMLQAVASQVPLCMIFSTEDNIVLKKRLVLHGVADVTGKYCTIPAIEATETTTEATRAVSELLAASPTLEATLCQELLRLISLHVEAVDMKGLVWLEDLQGQQLNLHLGEVQGAASESQDTVSVRAEDGCVYQVGPDDLKHTCRPTEDVTKNLTDLTFLHDVAVLHNLRCVSNVCLVFSCSSLKLHSASHAFRRRYFGGGTGRSDSDESFYCTFIGNILVCKRDIPSSTLI